MLKITDFCPNNCLDGKYCFAGCNPNTKSWIDRERIGDIFRQAKSEGLKELAYISTEPFTDLDFLVDVTKKAREEGITPRFLVTNGKIGKSYDNAKNHFNRIKNAGFTFSVDETYLGTGYNGIDVSVDQFHNIPPEYVGNTILAALDTFGPTIFVSIRTTDPADSKKDPTTLNSVVRYLQESGKVNGINSETKEIVFIDGSRVKVNRLRAEKFGLAKNQPDDFFEWRNFRLEELVEYKDLRESHTPGMPFPYHRLYINPNGQTFPELGRFEILSGGNIYERSVAEAIQNINDNPLIALLITAGFAGLLTLINQQLGVPLNLHATGDLHLKERYISQKGLMEKAQTYLKESGVEQKIRKALSPSFKGLRDLYENGKIKMRFG